MCCVLYDVMAQRRLKKSCKFGSINRSDGQGNNLSGKLLIMQVHDKQLHALSVYGLLVTHCMAPITHAVRFSPV
jgi:hypothetical protein